MPWELERHGSAVWPWFEGGRLDRALINLSLVESRPLATRAVRVAEQAFAVSSPPAQRLPGSCAIADPEAHSEPTPRTKPSPPRRRDGVTWRSVWCLM